MYTDPKDAACIVTTDTPALTAQPKAGVSSSRGHPLAS